MKMNLTITKINMKTKIKFITAAILMLLFVSCAEDIVNDKTKKSEEEGTVFVGGKFNTNAPAKSRSGISFDTLTNEIEFVWTYGDKIYLADGTASEQWNKNNNDRVAKTADFIFRGKTFTEPSYDIYFPGNKGTIYNKVKIPEDNGNSSTLWMYNNRATYSPYENDCGFAKAIRQPDGKYYFDLEHQSAFITLCPYSQNKKLGYYIVFRGATITADTNITGEYTITPNGLTGSGSSKVVKIPFAASPLSQTDPGRHQFDGSVKNRGLWNTFTCQIAPAKTKLKIDEEYEVWVYYNSGSWLSYDSEFKIKRTKYIPLHDYKKNTFTPINTLIAFPTYKPEFYVWDSEKDKEILNLCKDHIKEQDKESIWTDGPVLNIPIGINYSNPTATTATKSAKDCPNKVEAAWYIAHGDLHWDENYLWTNGQRIYRGAMWILKKNNIPGFNSTTLPADVTFTGNSYTKGSIQQGTPTDTTKYFVLPSQGNLYTWSVPYFKFTIGYNGYYWTRDAYNTSEAWGVFLSKNWAVINKIEKNKNAYSLWTVQ